MSTKKYKFLTEKFLKKYKTKEVPMTDFGHFVYLRTYSRWIEEEGRREDWWETVARAVDYNCSLDPNMKVAEVEELYDNVFHLRQFLSGRTMFTGGTAISDLYKTSNYNCSFVVIDNLKAYSDMFYLSMVGAGVGFRVLKEDVNKLPKFRRGIEVIHETYRPVPKRERQELTSINQFTGGVMEIVIGDSKEGWTQALEIFFDVFTSNTYNKIKYLVVNYNNIRPIGEKLKIFGGTASGHTSMQNMIEKITRVLHQGTGEFYKLKTIDAMDIANIIAENVVSGGVRRSAQICLFGEDDDDILTAKSKLYTVDENGNWSIDKNISHRSMSNNSIFYTKRPSEEQIKWQIEQMRFSGEPAFLNGEAMSKRRENLNGTNPCGEILLDSRGFCNLTTVNVMAFVDENETLQVSKLLRAQELSARAGYRMATIELELQHWNHTQERDRLIGCSFTGWQDMVNITSLGRIDEKSLLQLLRKTAINSAENYAKDLGLRPPLLVTTIKPEGTLSCLPTVSSGIHYSHSPYFIRRVRVSAHDPLVKVCEKLGYNVFPEVGQDWETCTTKVVEFPVKAPKGKTKYDVSAIEQLENYKMTMENYTQHNTSITVSVREHEWEEVTQWMIDNWDSVIGISFLALDDSFYQLLPFEAITEEKYNEMVKNMKPFSKELLNKLEGKELIEEVLESVDCASGACPVR